MPPTQRKSTVRRFTPAILLVFATVAVTSVVGFHAHVGVAVADDGVATSTVGACHACALSHVPAVPVLAHARAAIVEPVLQPISDDSDEPRTFFVERPQHGRAPPVR